MIKSIIELTDLIQKYKQEIFWESEKLKKKFNAFYCIFRISPSQKINEWSFASNAVSPRNTAGAIKDIPASFYCSITDPVVACNNDSDVMSSHWSR